MPEWLTSFLSDTLLPGAIRIIVALLILLIGFKVIDEATGNIVGTIQAVDDSTINVLFTIATPQGEVLLPASDDLICAFDRQAQTITMTIPDGLLSL